MAAADADGVGRARALVADALDALHAAKLARVTRTASPELHRPGAPQWTRELACAVTNLEEAAMWLLEDDADEALAERLRR